MVSQILGRIRDATRRLASRPRRRADMRGFVASYAGDVAAGDSITLHVKNDSSSVVADVEAFSIGSQFRGSYTIYDAFSSAPSGGTSVAVDNLRMDSAGGPPDSGNMTVNHSVTFTASGTHWEDVLPSGGAGQQTSGGNDTSTEPLIEPGREIVIELTNDTDSTTRPGALGVIYTEVDENHI